MMDRINQRLRAKIQPRGYGDHSQQICGWSASSFGALRQFQSRIDATTYEQAWHYPFPESLVGPTGFALEGLPYAKRVYEKTARRRARRASQNYITPSGLQRLKDEHQFLLTRERPAVTKVVAWAASNG